MFSFARTLDPFRGITFRFGGVFILPSGVAVLAAPAVVKPPFIVNTIEFAFVAIFPIAFQKIVGIGFYVFPQ